MPNFRYPITNVLVQRQLDNGSVQGGIEQYRQPIGNGSSGPLAEYQAAQQSLTPDQADILSRNSPYVASGAGNFSTPLPPLQEAQFRDWLAKNKVPFDPSGAPQDYDMRGFYLGLQNGHPQAMTAVNQNDGQLHYPDYWKTPLHESFSNESQWAGPNAPRWNDKDQLVTPDGRVVFDERAKK